MKIDPNAPAYHSDGTRGAITVRLYVMTQVHFGEIDSTQAKALMGYECPTGPGKDLERVRYWAEAEARLRAVYADAIIAEYNRTAEADTGFASGGKF